MLHTSESLKAQDTDFENWHYDLQDGEQYQLTDGELGWLKFVTNRYSIADHIHNNLDGGIYTVDIIGMSKALVDDGGSAKAVCLSDDSALNSIFFYSNVLSD